MFELKLNYRPVGWVTTHDVPGGVVIGLSMGLGDVAPRILSNLKLSQQWNLSWWGLCE